MLTDSAGSVKTVTAPGRRSIRGFLDLHRMCGTTHEVKTPHLLSLISGSELE